MDSSLCKPQTDLKAARHPHERHFERLQRVTAAHRKTENRTIAIEQLNQGRPDLLWSPCGNPHCDSNTCLRSSFLHWSMYFRRRAKDGHNGPDYIWQAIDQLGNVVWPGATNCADKMSRQMILGSFFHSPPARSAYFQFRLSAAKARILTDRKKIQPAICQATPFVEKIIGDIDLPENHELICWYLGPAFDEHIDQRTLADVVVRYMLLCEMWRRYPSERSTAWNFGPPKVLCDLYGGMLLSMRTLELFKLARRVPLLKSETANWVWGRWMQDYPLCTVIENPYVDNEFLVRSACRPDPEDEVPGQTEATVLEEVGYLGGVGTYTPTVCRKVRRRRAMLLNVMDLA